MQQQANEKSVRGNTVLKSPGLKEQWTMSPEEVQMILLDI